MNLLKNKIFLHLGGSIFFLLIPVLLSPDFALDFHFLKIPPFQKSFLSYCLLLVFFYVNYYILIPEIFERKLRWLYPLVMIAILFLICYCLFEFMANQPGPDKMRGGEFRPGPPRHPPTLWRELFMVLPSFLFVLALTFFIRTYANLKQIQKEKAVSELNMLKAQINPHFLFNSLNSIYSLALVKSEQTAESILNLSTMMRYVLYETGEDLVPLEAEMNYIHNYIELNKLRLSDNIQLQYERAGEIKSQKIAPLILIPFIENVFKHGINTEKIVKLKVSIDIADNFIELKTENEVQALRQNENKGIGQAVTKKRLELMYKNKYELHQKTENNIYYLHLKIFLS